jgi:hypothetical protein
MRLNCGGVFATSSDRARTTSGVATARQSRGGGIHAAVIHQRRGTRSRIDPGADMADVPDTATYLHQLANLTTFDLWRAARREPNVANLVFPNHRGTEVHRVSEQEARCIAQRLITEAGYYFSIETPTKGRFKFRGKETSRARSAQHDLSLYTAATPDTLVGHLEFKQGHRTERAGVGVHEIYKDLVKLVDSGLDSLWFHSFPKPTKNEFAQLKKFFGEATPKALATAKAQPKARIIIA